jgi:hypothetical protein
VKHRASLPAPSKDRWRQLLKGIVEYRLDHCERSLPWLEQALRTQNVSLRCTARYFRAMASARLGRLDEAARDYRQGFEDSVALSIDSGPWRGVLLAYFAQAEAEASLGPLAAAARPVRFRRPTAPAAVPGVVQAEDIDDGGSGVAFRDQDGPNLVAGWPYRATPVGVENCPDEGGGFDVGGTRQGDWLAFTVEVQGGGLYAIDARAASLWPGAAFDVRPVDGDQVLSFEVPRTGAAQAYTTVTRQGLRLPPGRQTILVVFQRAGAGGNAVCNLNWLRFRKVVAE